MIFVTEYWFIGVDIFYRFVVGKFVVLFYYILVSGQLTIIIPWLVRIVKGSGKIRNFMWRISFLYQMCS